MKQSVKAKDSLLAFFVLPVINCMHLLEIQVRWKSWVYENLEIVRECRLCCLEDNDDSTKQVKSVKLNVHYYTLGSFTEVAEFIKRYSERYTNLTMNKRAKVAIPQLQLVYEDDKSEVIQIGNWKTDQIRDFCDSILVRKE